MKGKTIRDAVITYEVKKKTKVEKYSVPIIVDDDRELQYEKHNWIIRILRFPVMLILNILPANLGKKVFTAFSGHTGDTSTVRRWSTTYRALEVMYTFQDRRAQKHINASDFFWELFLSNARSIRNRLQLVKKILVNVIKDVANRKPRVNLISLGSGSARPVIEALMEINGVSSAPPVWTKLIDMSRGALNYSRDLAVVYNVNQIEFHRDYVQNLKNYCNGFQPDVIEIVGLLDYYPYEQAVDLMAEIYKVLSPGGWLITCNIRPNLERPFVTKAINWPLIYRSPQELADILVEAGFPVEHLKIIYEPLKIHGLAICQKVV